MSGRRWVNVRITDDMLNLLLRGREDARFTSDWPEDARIVAGSWDIDRGQLVLTIESAAFDEVLLGDHLPDWRPTVTAHAVEPSSQALINLIDKMAAAELAERVRGA